MPIMMMEENDLRQHAARCCLYFRSQLQENKTNKMY